MISIDENKKRRFILNVAFTLAILAIVYIVLKYAVFWFLPFIIGLVIALSAEPMVRVLVNKLKLKRSIASIISILILVSIIGLLIFLLISIVFKEMQGLTDILLNISKQITASTFDGFNGLKGKISGILESLPPEISIQANTMLKSLIDQLVKIPANGFNSVLKILTNTATSIPAILLTIVVSLVSSVFLSMDYPKFRAFFLRQLPEKHHHIAIDVKFYAVTSLGKLFRAYATLMFITFIELTIGLSILDIKYAITIALVVALVDVLPVLGTGTVLIPWAIVTLVMGNTFLGVSLLILYAVIMIVRNILEPRIVGQQIGLHPLVTLLAIITGLQLFGLTGMIAFPITIIILKNLQDSGKIKIWN